MLYLRPQREVNLEIGKHAKLVVTAAAQAQKAADLILNVNWSEQKQAA